MLPVRKSGKRRMRAAQQRARFGGQQGGGALVDVERALREQEARAVGQLVQSVCARVFSSGIARTSSARSPSPRPSRGATRAASRASSASRM